MKRLVFTLLALFLLSSFVQAQSKFSYSILSHSSTSLDDVTNICIFRAPPLGGVCFDLEASWKTNLTLAVNYEASSRFRIQSGLSYNTLAQDVLNRQLGTDRYKLKFLSIPIRAHYFITTGKTRFYSGLGLRTDIRTNPSIPTVEGDGINDNARSFGLSMEALIGLEIPLMRHIKFNIEPTYSGALTNYTKDLTLPQGAFFDGLISEKPKRIGISLGLTYNVK